MFTNGFDDIELELAHNQNALLERIAVALEKLVEIQSPTERTFAEGWPQYDH